MNKHRSNLAALAACMLLPLLGGCDKSTGESGGGGSGLTAKYEGEAWEAQAIGIYCQALGSAPGCFNFGGTQVKAGISTSIIVTVYNVADTGTYPLGTDASVYGGYAQAGQSTGEGGGKANSWITDGTGMDGEIHISKIGAGHLTATFKYVAIPGKNNPLTVNRTITEGKVDLDYSGTPVPVLGKHGGFVRASLGGKPYNAATLYVSMLDLNGNPGLTINTTTSLNGVSILLAGVTGKGVYNVIHMQPNPRSVNVGRNSSSAENCCWGAEGDVASVEITEFGPARVKGTFKGTLVPAAGKPATTSLTVTDGTFDIGIP